ncbi:hypothetical protein [Paenibacillus sp. L3-i20]|uniref:hypothetical protein n=1 Tax=Paenibacillus sp. L3-i20 TaxID=2905833 RepID=UPI001EDD08F8|nr:hypothetical protein [Paenibacillus sp. L3-i20]GKU76880.1 hypothetical protein L3i20_v212770 [Paenibacillus sp. L3-i20]
MSNLVDCPYCEYENDVSDSHQDPSNNKFDFECGSCEKEFEVEVEYNPNYSASEIVWVKCQSCGTETREPYSKGRIHPFPKFIVHDCICEKCWKEAYVKELELKRVVQDES